MAMVITVQFTVSVENGFLVKTIISNNDSDDDNDNLDNNPI